MISDQNMDLALSDAHMLQTSNVATPAMSTGMHRLGTPPCGYLDVLP